jgi:serine/threonine protein kinase
MKMDLLIETSNHRFVFSVCQLLSNTHELQNILVNSKPPEHWWVKIGDFGISKRIKDTIGPSVIGGTTAFMAPELHGFIHPSQNIDPYAELAFAADIWALGEITYQLIARSPTFTNVGMLSRYVQNDLAFPLKELENRGVTCMAQYFVLSIMNPSPMGRPMVRQVCCHPWILLHDRPHYDISKYDQSFNLSSKY